MTHHGWQRLMRDDLSVTPADEANLPVVVERSTAWSQSEDCLRLTRSERPWDSRDCRRELGAFAYPSAETPEGNESPSWCFAVVVFLFCTQCKIYALDYFTTRCFSAAL